MENSYSQREYRKDYEKSKTIYRTPLDMLQVTRAKKSQEIASAMDYKHILHNCSYPPDSINMDLAKEAYALQSDVEYKADYNSWMKGCGWVPFGSLEMGKAKRASDTLNEHTKPEEKNFFTSTTCQPTCPSSSRLKLMPTVSMRICTKTGLKDLSKKGYDLRTDTIPIRASKAAWQAASEVQYKKDYENTKGKMVGFQSLQDDPKLVHYMNVVKIQSDREYKKDYEKTKTKYNTPHDVFNVVVAKKAQDVASNVNYKHTLHHYTYLPDAMDLE
ncbi:nebulin-like [Canis aureus]